jgi:hypothetical protein
MCIRDRIGTLSGGYERFCDEIERAETENANLIVLVESDYNASLMFHKLKRTYKNIRTNPQHIFHNIRTVIQEYPNVQFLFVKDRRESIRVMKRIREVEKRVDYDKLAITQDKLCNFMMQNEKLLHESVKSSSEENREEKNKVDNEISKLSTNELLSKLEKLNGQDPVIDGVIVKD